jgi:Tfp pilus assembly protein PilN
MAQQINLYSPILLTPRRYFSALAMLQALAALALGLLLFAGWTTWSTRQLKAELATSSAAGDRQKQALAAALAARPVLPADPAALQQELAQARSRLAERRALLAELNPPEGPGHAALLRLLAQTAPASLWLTEVKRSEGRIELAGVAQQPEALRPWLARLAADPLFEGTTLRAVKVERGGAEAEADTWRFRVVSSRAAGEAR